jgi:hypothetical protein
MSDTRSANITTPRTAVPAAAPQAAHAMTLFVMIVATLYFGKEVLMPVTLALLLAFVLAPMVNLLRHVHLGRVPSVLLGVTLGLCVILAIGGVIGSHSPHRIARRDGELVRAGRDQSRRSRDAGFSRRSSCAGQRVTSGDVLRDSA